jgi:hypothetical protein
LNSMINSSTAFIASSIREIPSPPRASTACLGWTASIRFQIFR